jgi:hypothetical protein
MLSVTIYNHSRLRNPLIISKTRHSGFRTALKASDEGAENSYQPISLAIGAKVRLTQNILDIIGLPVSMFIISYREPWW